MNLSSTAAVPQRTDSKPSKSTGYEITQTIRMSREEWRNQRLHEIADAFMDAFEVRA